MKRKSCFSVFKVLQFFLLTLLLLNFLLISGCSPISNLLFGPSGSIEVTTYPSGAKIFLNGNDTGYITPYTIPNLLKGTYEVKVVLGDISYTKIVIVYADNTSSVYKDLVPRLNKIVVQPSSMNLEIGESKSIDSITAYYIDSGSTVLNPSYCNYSSSSKHAIVDSVGTITGVSKGSATITISYTDVEITKTDGINIFVKIELPKAVINVTPSSSGYAPFTVSFDASNSTDISGIKSYDWNFGDGSTGTGMTTNHTYNNPGTYIVTLTVTDFYENKGIATISIIVREVGCPNANIQVTPSLTGIVPFTVAFDASGSSVNEESGSSITSYSWNFGDGNTNTGIITTHTYNNIGLYPVILTITDSNGKKDYATVIITVNEPGAPTAVISTVPDPPTGFAPLEMHFDAYNSSADVDITSYDWVFGDSSTGTGASINHTFNTAGTYVTSLTVTDSNGNVGFATVTITVNEEPVPGIGNITVSANPQTNVAGGASIITAIVTNTEGDVVADGTTVYFYTNYGTLSAESAETTNGMAKVTLTLDDNMQDGDKAKVTAFIGAVSSFVEVTCTEEIGPEIEITVSANPESNVPGGTSIISAKVNYEEGDVVPDGTTVYFYTNSGILSADSANTANGIATVNLTLDDNMLEGETATVTAFIGSKEGTVDVKCINIIITIYADDYSIAPAGNTTITAIVTDPEGAPVDGVIVIFFTNIGTLNPIYYITGTVVSGIATTSLTLDNIGDIATVTARCGSRVSNEIKITCE